jgi:hypothetical protein
MRKLRQLTKAEIDRRWPRVTRCQCQSNSIRDFFTEHEIPAGYRLVGKLIELTTTRDRFEDLAPGYRMTPVRPGFGWRIHDSSKDHHTTWCRDVFLIVEVQSS